jgi:hypothetical protein
MNAVCLRKKHRRCGIAMIPQSGQCRAKRRADAILGAAMANP